MADETLSGDFGPYVIRRDLGPGDRSHFYRAEHPEIGVVHLEVFLAEAREDPVLLHRHWRQKQLVGKLDHVNVLRILDANAVGGRFYIARETFDGRPLDEVVAEKGPFPAQEAIPLVNQVLQALGAAHEESILHEDLRPGDVFLGAMGKVKVGGFGRWAAGSPETSGGKASLEERLATLDGFSAPEQVLRAKLPDAATDVYRAGALLYWMVTSESPFLEEVEDEDPEALAEALLSLPPFVPSSVHSVVPWELDRVILKALEKRPGARFPSPSFMTSALEMVQRGERTWIRLEGRVRYAEWPWVLRIVVLVIILQIAYLIIFDPAKLVQIRLVLFP